jgi:6,7-dimethyl-8-ribityllumazine synthase
MVAIVVSRYNATITDALLAGAQSEYTSRGNSSASLTILHVPGAFELPTLAMAAASSGRFAGVLALGCIIKGETDHDRYIAQAVADGLVNITLITGVPVAFGVLTTNTPRQARVRASGSRGNKGRESMGALLDTIASLGAFEEGEVLRLDRAAPDKSKKGRA